MKARQTTRWWGKLLPAIAFIAALGFGSFSNTPVFAGGPGLLTSHQEQSDLVISKIETSTIEDQPDSVIVRWRTSASVKAWVEYGTEPNMLDHVAYNTRGAETTTRNHKVLIRGVDQQHFYFLIVLANGQRFDNSGRPFQIDAVAQNKAAAVSGPILASQSATIPSSANLDTTMQTGPVQDTQVKTRLDFTPTNEDTPILVPNAEPLSTNAPSDIQQTQSESTSLSKADALTGLTVTIPSMKLPWAAGTQQFTGGPHGGSTSWTCSDLRSLASMSGLDFGMTSGTEVLAVAAGTIVFSGYDTTIGYAVGIDHNNNFGTRYWHLSSIDSSIKIGVQVKQGQLLGKSGSPPGYNSPHLHLEFRQWNGTNWSTSYPAHGIQIDGYTARAFIRSSDNQGFNYQGTLTRGIETTTLANYCGSQIKLWSGNNGTVTASAYGGAPVVSTNIKATTGQASVIIQQVYTTDGNGVAKTSFRPGDTIRYYARVNNSGSAGVSATLAWLANGPAQVVSWSGNLTIAPGTADWYLGSTLPSNAPGGTYTLRVQATYNSTTSQATSNFTVASATAVTVQQVYTTDGNGVAKTSFRPGDTIRYYARVNNSGSAGVSATLAWLANGPAQVVSWSGNLTIAPGTADWYLGSTLPSNAPGGTYTLRVQATYNSTTSQATSNFTVASATAVTVQQVYTTDGNGVAKTSFRPGDTIRYYARVNNSGSAGVSATLAWLANGPAQVVSWSGNLMIAPGTADWYLESTLPSNAPGGTYTLRVQATYNSTTSQATSNFTVATQSQSETIVDELSSGFSKTGQYWWDDNARGLNGHMYWTYVNGSSVSSAAIWRPNLPSGRAYEVFAYIPDYHTNTVNAKYEIHYGGNASTTISRQQAPYSNQWISLGTFYFDAGTSGYVRLTDASGETSGSKQIGFDALKWVPR